MSKTRQRLRKAYWQGRQVAPKKLAAGEPLPPALEEFLRALGAMAADTVLAGQTEKKGAKDDDPTDRDHRLLPAASNRRSHSRCPRCAT